MADYRGDQAAGLRRLFGREQTRVVTFAAGSAGVGKSVLVANLGAALAGLGCDVLIVDENARSGVSACFGTGPRHDLLQVINGELLIEEAMVEVAPAVRVLSAARAVGQLAYLGERQQETLIHSMIGMERPADTILVDASSDHPLGFSPFGLASHETVVVMSPCSAAITDAYALIKRVSLGYARRDFRLLLNMVSNREEAEAIYRNMARLSHGRGVARLAFAGHVPLDQSLHQASCLAQPVEVLNPDAPSAQACRTIAADLLNWPQGEEDAGGLEHFVLQLLHLSQHIDPQPIYA
mgnify:CR=1 FL=1